jgi:ketosteroid isomerase-like protein
MKAVEHHLAALTPDQRALLALEDALMDAIRRRDPRGVRVLLRQDFALLGPDGSELDVDAFVSAVTSLPGELLEVSAEHLRARVIGGVGVLTGLQRARVRLPDGTVAEEVQAFTDVCTRSDDGWRMALAHSAPFLPPPR